MNLLDVNASLQHNGSNFVIVREQEITPEFLDDLKSQRVASANVREGEFHQVSSVPVAVWDLWCHQGLDPDRMTAREIVAKLKRDNLEAFIVTGKSL